MRQVQTQLRKAGRLRYLSTRAEEIVAALRGQQMKARSGRETAYIATISALTAVIIGLTTQLTALQGQVESSFGQHLRR